jgi:hypothetical protein
MASNYALPTGLFSRFPFDIFIRLFFEDSRHFPTGSVVIDCALLMRGIKHEWHGREELRESA